MNNIYPNIVVISNILIYPFKGKGISIGLYNYKLNIIEDSSIYIFPYYIRRKKWDLYYN